MVGSVHCLGMCGPLVIAYSLHLRPEAGTRLDLRSPWKDGVSHHLLFHSGRILTYGLLGALAAAFANFLGASLFLSHVRGAVSLAGGILMVFFGLALLKLIPSPLTIQLLPARFSPRLMESSALSSKWLLGMGAGFLPCMLSWAMISKAATAQNPLAGFLVMALFGLGTLPALFLTGLSASLFTLKIRILGERVAAASVIALGVILVFKGARYFV